MSSGECTCSPGVTGDLCDICLPDSYGFSAEGCRLATPLVCCVWGRFVGGGGGGGGTMASYTGWSVISLVQEFNCRVGFRLVQ